MEMVRERLKHKHVASLMRENPDGHSGSKATRGISNGFRTGIKDADWMRTRCPSKVTKRTLSLEEVRAL